MTIEKDGIMCSPDDQGEHNFGLTYWDRNSIYMREENTNKYRPVGKWGLDVFKNYKLRKGGDLLMLREPSDNNRRN